ncbi:tachylectin-related carbohydrate-binding protein [Actinosynnema sp. NPDC059797]
MTRPRLRPFRRLARISLVAALGVVGLPLLTSTAHVAQAVETARCAPSANVFTAIASNPDLRLRKHNDPASGKNSWTGDQGIGWGWDTRFFAGANGYVFSISGDGGLWRYRWDNASGWENGGTAKLLQSGWVGWEDPRYRNRVTADTNNHIYAVGADGNLALHSYDEAAGTITRQVIATGWGRYDQVFAAGDGVLYARDPSLQNGILYRFHYDHDTGTWLQQGKDVGWGWNGYKQLASAGADTVYGLTAGGELWWYRYLPAEEIWLNHSHAVWRQHLATWSDIDQIAIPVDSCRLGQVATDVQCKPSADFFASLTNNDFRIRPYAEPETGLSSWDVDRGIGQGWNDRFVAGANGWKFSFRSDGTVHRLRWNGTAWDNNGVSEQIATGWGGWNDPRYRYRITVDTNNHVYGALAVGDLQRSVYDEVSKTWTQEVIDTGWGKYDQVFAAGDGVLYARDPAIEHGALYRFHYDWKSRRWLDYATKVSSGWNGYKQIISPGADVIYGLSSAGEVYWYRYDPVTRQHVHGAEDTWKEHILTWPGASEIAADVDACKPVTPVTVTPPSVPAPNDERAQVLLNPSTQRLEIAFVSNSGVLHRGYQTAAGTEYLEWQALSGFEGHSGRAALALRQDGRLVAMARDTGAQARAYTQDAAGSSHWTGPAMVNGSFNSSPVLVRGTGGLLIAFATDTANKLWYSEQFSATGGFKPWRQATNNGTYNMTGDFTVVPSGDGFEIAYRSASNAYAVKKFTNGSLGPARVASGITGPNAPGAVVFADGKVQLVARAFDNKLYTQKEGAAGFPSTNGWTDISAGVTFGGTPSALLNAHGIVEVAVRDSAGSVRRSGQTAPGATTWRAWHDYHQVSVVDPTFASAGGAEQRIFALDEYGEYYLWQTTAYTSDSATARRAAPPADVLITGEAPVEG